ncbi:hypothetical protein BV22DRAFT_83413 [Leucogyrophana mollusca]|uniref:Uncharacterized protein n=1 Tax=Leucogyrophana mollusca TaxID=85980 RepID=A0ACB8BX19_9AGAM|nr:hypothetical protein BV22DRAFT_83413 [Leucogyrophana mollusca]
MVVPVALILKIVTTVLQGLAILLTLFRLWYRFSIRRFWWEDTWAAVALLCGIALLVSHWVQSVASPGIAIAAYWVYTFAFASVIWAVRLSVLFSITRLIYPDKVSRFVACVITTLFVLLWGGVVSSKAYWCGSNLSWYKRRACSMPRSLDIYELSTDVVSDAILVVLPLRLLWSVKLPENSQRRIILSIFSSSVVVTFTSIFRAVCRLKHLNHLTVAVSDFQVAFSLIVCNLLVTVTYIYRIWRGDGEVGTTDVDETPFSHSRTTSEPARNLTTIDLDHLYDSGTNIDVGESKVTESQASAPQYNVTPCS